MANEKKINVNVAQDSAATSLVSGINGQATEISSFHEDGLYNDFISSFQRGDWQQSETVLNKLCHHEDQPRAL